MGVLSNSINNKQWICWNTATGAIRYLCCCINYIKMTCSSDPTTRRRRQIWLKICGNGTPTTAPLKGWQWMKVDWCTWGKGHVYVHVLARLRKRLPEGIGCFHDNSRPAVVSDLHADVKDNGNSATAFQLDVHACDVGHRQIHLFSVHLWRNDISRLVEFVIH